MPRTLTALLVLSAAPLLPAADLTTLSGKKLAGDLVAIDGQGVTLRVGGGEVVTPAKDVLFVDLQSPAAPPADAKLTAVELTDGSVFWCDSVTVRGKEVEMTVPPGLTVKAPLSAVFTVLKDALEPRFKLEWQNILARRGKTDLLVIQKKSEAGGTERVALEALEGTFGDADAEGEKIAFELTTGQRVSPRFARVHGMVFLQRPGEIPPTLCKLTDAKRNVLTVKALALTEGGAVTVTTVSGVTVAYPDAKALAKLDYSGGKLTYLSDLEPVLVDQSTTEDRIDPYRRDRNLDDGPIRVAGQPFGKGLALHARTVLAYDLGGDYREFKAVLGVDESVATDSRVRVSVEGDSRELFAAEVGRKDKPRPVAVDVRGVRQLKVTVTSVGILDLGNQVILGDAKVSK